MCCQSMKIARLIFINTKTTNKSWSGTPRKINFPLWIILKENNLKGPVVKIIQKQKKQLQDSLGHQLVEDGSGDKEVGDGMDYMELLKIVIH